MRNGYTLLLFFLFFYTTTWAQTALVRGKVTDKQAEPLELASIGVEGTSRGTVTNARGEFELRVAAGREVTLIFAHVGYKRQTFLIRPRAEELLTLDVVLEEDPQYLKAVEIAGTQYEEKRDEVSVTKINPRTAKELPSAFGDFTKILATLPGVISNNELSAEYSVRGGNFDENLVYVNDIQVYRPFLVRAGQQEGLSFVNPDLVTDVEFSAGGWQPRYGDKLSSVLNIRYKEPTKFAASASLSLLSSTAHVEGATPERRFTYVIGARQKSARYLFNTLAVQGDYFPRFYDVQSYFTWDLTSRKSQQNRRTVLGLLTSFARNRYELDPKSQQTTFGTIRLARRLTAAFDGQETYGYDTYQTGLRLSHRFSEKVRSDMVAAVVRTQERENVEIEGFYRLSEVNTNTADPDFNQNVNERDVAGSYSYSRNALQATIFQATSRNYYFPNERHAVEWGGGYDREMIDDRLYEYYFKDSAEYVRGINGFLNDTITLNSFRLRGYAQHSMQLGAEKRSRLTYGARLNYWSVNQELLVSPRVQYSFEPAWQRDFVFKLAVGAYHQPPFYRELRDSSGVLNLNLKAQRSIHFIVGSDYNFLAWGRPFKFTSEVYYKNMWNVVPYDVDNVRIRYFAENNAVAYAAGADFRVSGEFVRGAESWFTLSLLSTKENILDDTLGYLRRPTDQRVTAAIMFRDHLPNNPTVRMFLNLVFGSGLPYRPPGDPRYRNLIQRTPLYRRVDIGFSKIFIFDEATTLSNYMESIWIGLELLNAIGAQNVISYQWVRDLDNRQYAVPNTLSARYLNLRLVARF
ncbi:TonB-dependent Receptor Plug Domain [Catalinimonas alkaloidigena]|uniref:TonB-dependent Receptor Plug Domain n=1 Tax=Catalinimonas alkaloidigena TaxID=1075417 RepID=A0A1G9J861_9BACT|nr:carboxypeptidase-like regulatory domain-containing protein [Catalinimonas alkaloidigena]SDL33729.1 TonB-dependent Receptor Plug Domain [Catalinimonas alkaloidigena]